jgi:hypothetical protein
LSWRAGAAAAGAGNHTDRQSGAALQKTCHMPRRAAARIRAMITLWQQGGKRRAEVGKRARDLR